MSIPAAFLDELRARTSLSTVIQRSTPLKKAGREWKACCPFHQEKSASFTVNDEKGFYHCFGCGAHGDVIRWLVEQNGLTFLDAVRELAAQAGMEVPAADPRAAEREKTRDGNLDIMQRAANAYSSRLASEPAARTYLADRGISDALLTRFQIGFAPGTKMGDPPYIRCIGAPDDDLAALGLVKRNPETGSAYDFFRRRIVIPIHDARGRVIGFGGRIIGDGEPKYLNSPDTPVFDKGRTLFNLHRAAPAARANDRLVIVEGYFDVISLDGVGMSETVAPNGTALTEAQLAIAWKLVDSPTLCLDGDNAGRRAALRAAVNALPRLQPGKGLWFVFPPDGRDPDDVARKGGLEAVTGMLEDRIGIAEIVWQDCLQQLKHGTPEQFSRVRRNLRDLVGSINDPDVRDAYTREFLERLDAFGKRQGTLPRRKGAPARAAVHEAVQDALMCGILHHPGVMLAEMDTVARIRWSRPENDRLVDALYAIYDDQPSIVDGLIPEALERRGVGDEFRAAKTRQTLRFPFLTLSDRNAAREALVAALQGEAAARK